MDFLVGSSEDPVDGTHTGAREAPHAAPEPFVVVMPESRTSASRWTALWDWDDGVHREEFSGCSYEAVVQWAVARCERILAWSEEDQDLREIT